MTDDLADAIIKDTTRCQCCTRRLVLGGSDCIVVEAPQANGTVAAFVICEPCARAVHDTYRDFLCESGICEHGVPDEKFCPDCLRELKQSRRENGEEP